VRVLGRAAGSGRYGERIRLTLVNATRMNQPMHLHRNASTFANVGA
jgi:FtsP/CotA-like multicopper oxidase with cupredoxin domain